MSTLEAEIKTPVFIIGVGRSGTSLLQSMLNAHNDICFLPETQFLRKYLFQNRRRKAIERYGTENFKNALLKDVAYNRLNIAPDDCLSGISVFSVFDVYQNILTAYLNRTKKKVVGDKDPRNIDFIETIHLFFPRATILHIIRDPRDVVLSRTKAAWSKQWPFYLHPCLYNIQIRRGRRVGYKQFGQQYVELFYEDLIENPKNVLRKISSQIGVDYDSSMLGYQKAARELVSESEMQWKKETLGPLLSNNKEKWKTAFSNYQITMIERICAPALKELPYKPYGKWDDLSLWEKVKIQCAVGFSKVFALIYPLRVKWL